MEKIEAVVKVTRDGFIEVPCEEAVAGDEIRVSLQVEEWVVDAEEEDMARLAERLRREREENPEGPEDFVPLRQVIAEREEAERAAADPAEAQSEQGAALSRAA